MPHQEQAMLGVSMDLLDKNIAKCLAYIRPKSVLDYGAGHGKLGRMVRQMGIESTEVVALQTLFEPGDRQLLLDAGYTEVIDTDILEYVKRGIPKKYDMISALDVIEHFMWSDAMSIIDYSLYCCDWMLLLWPSRCPQPGTNPLDIHRTSFELHDLTNRFDIIYYSQTGMAEASIAYRYHIALLRGHMNIVAARPASL